MNKEEIERRIKKYELVRECSEENLNELNIALRDLCEAEKPLGHGDFGYSSRGCPFVVVEQSSLFGSPKAFFDDTSGQQKADVIMTDAIRLGNIFGLLKEWSENLTYFEFDVHHCEINTVEFPHAPIHIAGNWHTLSEAEEIWHKLGRVIATLKRKNP